MERKHHIDVVSNFDMNLDTFLRQELENIFHGSCLSAFISSSGGDPNIAANMVLMLKKAEDHKKISTCAYAGRIVFSSALLFFSSFKARYAHEDSSFLVHGPVIVDENGKKTKNDQTREFEKQMTDFLSKSWGISVSLVEHLVALGEKEERISSEEALKYGIVQGIIPLKSFEGRKKLLKENF